MLTSRGNHKLRIDLEDWNGEKAYALFKSFKVGDQSTNYTLTISGYSGNAGNLCVYIYIMLVLAYFENIVYKYTAGKHF